MIRLTPDTHPYVLIEDVDPPGHWYVFPTYSFTHTNGYVDLRFAAVALESFSTEAQAKGFIARDWAAHHIQT